MSKWKKFNKIAFAIVLLLVPLSVRGETILNRNQYDFQKNASITRLSDGKFVAGWYSDANGLKGHWFNIFDSDFDRRFSWEAEVPWVQGLSRDIIKFAASEDSFYVAAFARWSSDDTTNMDIYINKYNNEGGMLIEDARVNSDTVGDQWIVSVILDDANDKIVVIWGTNPQSNPDLNHYYLRQIDFELLPIAEDIPLYIGDDESIIMRDVKKLSATRLIAIFQREYYYSFEEVMACHFNYDGSDPVDLYKIDTGSYPTNCILSSLSEIPTGGVLATWVAYDFEYEVGIWGRRFDENGVPIDPIESLLSVPDDDFDGFYLIQNSPVTIINDDESIFALSWFQRKGQNSPFDAMGRFLNFELIPLSDTFTINETGSNAYSPVVAYLEANNFVFCWDSYVDSNRKRDIFASIIQPPETGIYAERELLPEFQVNSYPNPFNAQTTIQYLLQGDSHVRVEIYDILGRNIATLLDEEKSVGHHQVVWYAGELPSGVYFYKINTDEFVQTGKMALLK